MKPVKKFIMGLLALTMLANLLFGCGGERTEGAVPTAPAQTSSPETQPPLPPLPSDGNPNDVTCKGTYSGAVDADTVVARSGSGALTNGQLQAWYWAAVASHREKTDVAQPDYEIPLDRQSCPMDSSVNSWQQYFLKAALQNWHTAQALYLQAQEVPLPVEEAFSPNEKWRAENMVDIPAMKYLYRENPYFQPNTMHQAWLDNIPTLLDTIAQEQGLADGEALAQEAFGTTKADLTEMVKLYNWAYMYDTNLSYYIETTDDEVESWFAEHEDEYAQQGITKDSGKYVTFRQILLVPEEREDYPGLTVEIAEDGTVTCGEELWLACEEDARDLIVKWVKHKRGRTEGIFGDFASKYSMDPSTAIDGGAFRQVEKGQMVEPIDNWIFEEGRKKLDYTTIRTKYGVHILCYCSDTDIWYARSQEDLTAQKQRQTILSAREGYDMTVTYSAITLGEKGSGISMDRLLYEDLAHERFPEVPLYLQQDYGHTMYGGYLLRTNGCGITSYAMLASYMVDDELTPPEMCARFGQYSTERGTDVTLMMYEAPAMGIYHRKTYDMDEALEALKDGHILISIQTPGYWTRGGHYIVVEKLNEDGTVQVRDSNIFNYKRIESHKQDKHTWESITEDNKTMWIIEKKLTRVPACSRCGDGHTRMLQEDYLCHKCRPALLRRDTYLGVVG